MIRDMTIGVYMLVDARPGYGTIIRLFAMPVHESMAIPSRHQSWGTPTIGNMLASSVAHDGSSVARTLNAVLAWRWQEIHEEIGNPVMVSMNMACDVFMVHGTDKVAVVDLRTVFSAVPDVDIKFVRHLIVPSGDWRPHVTGRSGMEITPRRRP